MPGNTVSMGRAINDSSSSLRVIRSPESYPPAQIGNGQALIPSSALIRQFKEAPPGKLYLLHGSGTVFRLSLSAAGHALLAGVPITLVDGTNRFDAYYIAEFARRYTTAAQRQEGRVVSPEELLERIYVSRAFTCYQMEAVVTERLPAFIRKMSSPVAIVFGLLDTFYDEQAPMFEVRQSLRRIIGALHGLKDDNISVLLASLDVKPASKERAGLFPMLSAAMDRVYQVTDNAEGVPVIVPEARGALAGFRASPGPAGHPPSVRKVGMRTAMGATGTGGGRG